MLGKELIPTNYKHSLALLYLAKKVKEIDLPRALIPKTIYFDKIFQFPQILSILKDPNEPDFDISKKKLIVSIYSTKASTKLDTYLGFVNWKLYEDQYIVPSVLLGSNVKAKPFLVSKINHPLNQTLYNNILLNHINNRLLATKILEDPTFMLLY